MATIETSPEAAFLESHKARSEYRKQTHEQRRQKTDELNVFWTEFKACVANWNEALINIKTGEQSNQNNMALSEDEKRKIQMKLLKLSKELKLLQKHCFAVSDLSSISSNGPSADNNNPSLMDTSEQHQKQTMKIMITRVPEDLPMSDLRLLHKEFTTCQEKLDKVRNQLLPKGKFVFRRYHEAMKQKRIQEEKQQLDPSISSSTNQQESREKTDTNSNLNSTASEQIKSHEQEEEKWTLRGYRYAHIVIQEDGSVQETAINSEKKDIRVKSVDDAASSLVLKDIQNCAIHLYAKNYKSLHLVSIHDSTIQVHAPVQGAVHVTSCQHVKLKFKSAQQLRLHESHVLKCHVAVSAGIILEGCKQIFFHVNTIKHQLDIKDFEWLRNGVPSPNFSIIEDEEEDEVLNAASQSKETIQTPLAKSLSSSTTKTPSKCCQNEEEQNKLDIYFATEQTHEDDDEL